MKKLAIIIFLTLTGLSCSDAINDLFDELNATVPVCIAFDSTAITPDGRGWANAYPTIAEGVDAAQPGQEIWVKAGTYNLSASITITKSVSIYGGFNGAEKRRNERSNNNQITIISQTLAGNILFDDTSAGKTILIDCFTIKGNHIEIILGASPAFNNCRFDKITYSGNGGALNMDDSSVTISQCTFDTCEASGGNGGAIYAVGSSLTISNSNFTGNSAITNGGAIYVTNCSLNIYSSYFTDNNAVLGGAIYAGGNSYITISDNSTFINNHATSYAGAIYLYNTNECFISGCTFDANSSGSRGGAIGFDPAANAVIENSKFYNNFAFLGGGAIYTNQTTTKVNIRGTEFRGNYATVTIASAPNYGYGGAINCYRGTIEIDRCMFYDNSLVYGRGGAIYTHYEDSAILSIVNSYFYYNRANTSEVGPPGEYGRGGAIYIEKAPSSGTHTFVNLSFYSNAADSYCGGIYFFEGTHTIYNSIFYQNTSYTGYPWNVYHFTPANLTLKNCFYDGGISAGASEINCINNSTNPPFIGTDYNIKSTFLYPADIIIDKGDNTAVPSGIILDLAGWPRFVDIPSVPDSGAGTPPFVDIGAYEAQ